LNNSRLTQLVAGFIAVLSLVSASIVIGASPAQAATYTGTITSTTSLYAGDKLVSANGQFRLAMQGDGNLVLYSYGNQVMMASLTFTAGSRLVLQGDGNLVIYTADDQPLWQTGTAGAGAAKLTLQDDGNLVLRKLNDTLLWASYTSLSSLAVNEQLKVGHTLRSPNGSYLLSMQGDGNLVLYKTSTNPWQAVWYQHSNTANSWAVLQGDGNFVLYRGNGTPYFQTGTSGSMSRVAVENDGRLVVYTSSNTIAWQSSAGAVGVPSSCSNSSCPRWTEWSSAWNTPWSPGSSWCWWGAACGHNCTNYAAWRMATAGISNWVVPSVSAWGWGARAQSAGFTVNNTPSVGAIAWWDQNGGRGSAGHVAVVQAVNGNTVTVSQDSYPNGPYSYQTISASSPTGYIHVPGFNG
jgi:surface antigen